MSAVSARNLPEEGAGECPVPCQGQSNADARVKKATIIGCLSSIHGVRAPTRRISPCRQEDALTREHWSTRRMLCFEIVPWCLRGTLDSPRLVPSGLEKTGFPPAPSTPLLTEQTCSGRAALQLRPSHRKNTLGSTTRSFTARNGWMRWPHGGNPWSLGNVAATGIL